MIDYANKEIEEALKVALRVKWEREQFGRVIRAIDDLLFQLEDLNLQGVENVPPTLRARADVLLNAVPRREDEERLKLRRRIVPMMDALFHAQELLFRLRDPSRALYYSDNEEDTEDEALEA